jgi:hypothetical protein
MPLCGRNSADSIRRIVSCTISLNSCRCPSVIVVFRYWISTRRLRTNTTWATSWTETALSVRVTRALKSELEKVALSEGRSVAQVCEALLNGGLEAYKKEGSPYLQKFITRKRRVRNPEA